MFNISCNVFDTYYNMVSVARCEFKRMRDKASEFIIKYQIYIKISK